MHDTGVELLSTPPATPEGIIAVLRYIAELDEAQLPETIEDADGDTISWTTILHGTLAGALCAIHGLEA